MIFLNLIKFFEVKIPHIKIYSYRYSKQYEKSKTKSMIIH